jgi:Mn-dependent DtxR family transcriptional regulator
MLYYLIVKWLNRSEVRVFEILLQHNGSITSAEICKKLNMQKSNLSIYLRELAGVKLISISRAGKRNAFSVHSMLLTEFTNSKRDLTHLKMEDILTGASPFFLAFMRTKRSASVSDLDIPPASANRMISKMVRLGIIYSSSKGTYSLRGEASRIAWFCSNFLSQLAILNSGFDAKSILQFRVSFESIKKPELVVMASGKSLSGKYWPTAYSVLADYGIKLVSAERLYFCSFKPDIQDVVIHMLAFGRDYRSVAYAAALMSKNKFDFNLLLKARYKFDVTQKFLENLVDFVNSKGSRAEDGFPSWKDVEEVLA